MKNLKYTVKGFIPDMGSYSTVARSSRYETATENALWSFNSARDHDGLPRMTISQFRAHIRMGRVKLTPIYEAP